MDELILLRQLVNQLDLQISSLLNQRMNTVDQIGKLKQEQNLSVRDQSREDEVLGHVVMAASHPVLKENLRNIYGAIMHESRVSQYFFRHMRFPYRTVGILGLGLIGGSICKALKLKDPSITLGGMTAEGCDQLLEEGWIDHAYSSLDKLVASCELLVLASPISTIIPYARQIARKRQQGKLIVIDVASVKGDIVDEYAALSSDNIEFVGTHPMAGSEESGFQAAKASLFVSRKWIIVPHERNRHETVEALKACIQFFGAEAIVMEPRLHDRQAALISHLPGMISRALFEFVQAVEPESMEIAGPGFYSFTRLAHDNPTLRRDILQHNHKIVYEYLEKLMEFIKNEDNCSISDSDNQ